jgi:GNAT superfamily N-acetyltransferase
MGLTTRQISQAGEALARAFHDNPGIAALLRDDSSEQRLALCTPVMTAFVRAANRYGLVEIIEEDADVVAVALMFGPGRYPPPFLFELIAAWGVLQTGVKRALRFEAIDRYMRRNHPRMPHWYLWFLGVTPERQGHGLGSRLLDALNQRALRDGVPCYLETDRLSSVRLYQRHGYLVQTSEQVPGLGFEMWFMQQQTPGRATLPNESPNP